jgi:hypothetical protein
MRIYIPTLGRADKQSTWQRLPALLRERTRFVIHERERASFADFDHVVCPVQGTNMGRVRQWMMEQHDCRDSEKVLMLDDDLAFDVRRTDIPTRFLRATDPDIWQAFAKLDELLDRHIQVALRHREMAPDAPIIEENARAIRAVGYHVPRWRAAKVRFDRCAFMEDLDMTLQLLRQGHSNAVYSAVIQGQGATNAPGGCSLARSLATQNADAKLLTELHAPFVKLREKQTSGTWGGERHYDVTVSWKEAYRSSQKAFTVPAPSGELFNESGPATSLD